MLVSILQHRCVLWVVCFVFFLWPSLSFCDTLFSSSSSCVSCIPPSLPNNSESRFLNCTHARNLAKTVFLSWWHSLSLWTFASCSAQFVFSPFCVMEQHYVFPEIRMTPALSAYNLNYKLQLFLHRKVACWQTEGAKHDIIIQKIGVKTRVDIWNVRSHRSWETPSPKIATSNLLLANRKLCPAESCGCILDLAKKFPVSETLCTQHKSHVC